MAYPEKGLADKRHCVKHVQMKPAHSIRELARRMKLSPATVSMALRGDVRIAEATRQRIINAAQEHGYHPNPMLARANTRTPGHVETARNMVGIAYLHQTEGPRVDYEALQQAAENRGFFTRKFHLGDYPSPPALQRMLRASGFRAVVFGPCRKIIDLREADWSDFVLIQMTRCGTSPRVSCLRRDETSAIRLAWSVAMAKGFARPGFCLYERSPLLEDDLDRIGAWHAVSSQIPPERQVPLLHDNSGLLPPARLRAWFDEHQPDVVIGFNRHMRSQFSLAGVEFPRDAAFYQMIIDDDQTDAEGVKGTQFSAGKRAAALVESLFLHGRFGIPELVEDLVFEPIWTSPDSFQMPFFGNQALIIGVRPANH